MSVVSIVSTQGALMTTSSLPSQFTSANYTSMPIPSQSLGAESIKLCKVWPLVPLMSASTLKSPLPRAMLFRTYTSPPDSAAPVKL